MQYETSGLLNFYSATNLKLNLHTHLRTSYKLYKRYMKNPQFLYFDDFIDNSLENSVRVCQTIK